MLIASLGLCLLPAQAAPIPAASRKVTVVHAETGEPIPGAEVLGVAEISEPVWGELWWTHRAVTDAAGEVLLPRPTDEASYGWLFARAAGFGTRAAGDSRAFSTSGIDDVRLELMPETPVLIELLDFTGSPLPLAHLGVAMGCGHTPDLLSVTTGRDGRATLRGFYPYDGGIADLFIVHPEVGRSTYSDVPLEDEVDGVVRVYAPSDGRLLRGQVLLPDLTPAVGYAVGSRMNHRGPWAITDAEGDFRFYGWDPDQASFEVRDPEGNAVAGFSGARDGVERLFVLDGTTNPEDSVDGQQGVEEPRGGVTVEIQMVGEGWERLRPWDRRVTVEAWDPITGRSITGKTKDPASVDQRQVSTTLHLPGGDYLVEVGRPDSPYAPLALGRVSVKAHVPTGLGDPRFVTTVLQAEVPVPRLVTIEVPDFQPDFTFYVHRRGFAESFEPGEEGVTLLPNSDLQVERFAVPYGRLGFSLERAKDGVFQRIDLEVVEATRSTGHWRLRKRQRD